MKIVWLKRGIRSFLFALFLTGTSRAVVLDQSGAQPDCVAARGALYCVFMEDVGYYGSRWGGHIGTGRIINGVTLTDHVKMADITWAPPSIAYYREKFFISYTNERLQVAVTSSDDGVTFTNKKALTYEGFPQYSGSFAINDSGTMYLTALIANELPGTPEFLQTTDGANWTFVGAPSEKMSDIPTIAYGGGRLYVAWRSGTFADGNYRLHVIQSADTVTWSHHVTLSDTSPSSPSLSYINDTLYMLWYGQDNKRLHRMESTDGITFGKKVIYSDTSDSPPVLVRQNGVAYMIWGGTDSAYHLNIVPVSDIPAVSPAVLNAVLYVIQGE